jgi:hypothetical protein
VALASGPGACHMLMSEKELLAEARRLQERAREGPRPRGRTSPDGRAYLANQRT